VEIEKSLAGFRHKKTALVARSRAFGQSAERHRGRAEAAGNGRRRVGNVVMEVDMMERGRAVNWARDLIVSRGEPLSCKERGRGEV
jgi:hypothetical protein